MKLLWGFAIVPTIYEVYIVVDKESGALKFVKEFNTRGHAVNWISKSGDKDITYCVQEHLQRR